ncbi:MAG: LCP family protein, partial [Lachnospiraceae bacterium]
MDTKTSPNETKTEADTTDNMPVNLPKNGKARKKALLSIFIILSLILIVLLLGIYAIFRFGYFGKSSYVPGNDYSVLDSIPPETYIDENGDTHTKEEATLDSGLESSIISSQESVLESIGQVPLETGTYNLLLIGVDRRDTSWNGNSDTMILVTINYDRQTIYMTSFLRDLYANIPEKGVRKLNAAYAYGGAPLCMDTIRCNYGVQIDNYAMVDFSAMIEIVDVLGGVDIELTEDEVSVANSYIKGMCRQFGESYEDHMLTGSGMLHL